MNTPSRPPTSINTTSYPTEFQQVILEKSQKFVGRDFVFAAISKFLQRHKRGYFTVVGAPGSGKSALLAKYVTDNPGVVYYNAQVEGKNCAEEFLPNICTQIVETFRRLGILPSTQIASFTVENLRTTSLNAILQLVSSQLETHQRMIIAIDALDSIIRDNQPPGSNLFYLPRYLPEGVYFLLTRRPYLREKSGLLIETPSQILNLNCFAEENRQDVQTYIRRELTSNPFTLAEKSAISEMQCQEIDGKELSEFIARFTHISENNFMYASQILPAITEGFYPNVFQFPDTLHTTNKLPLGLKNYYQTLWQKMKGEELSKLALDVLRVLIKATQNQEGVSVEKIVQIIDADEFDIEEVLEDWVEFLQHKEIAGKKRNIFFHSSFCDWLINKISD